MLIPSLALLLRWRTVRGLLRNARTASHGGNAALPALAASGFQGKFFFHFSLLNFLARFANVSMQTVDMECVRCRWSRWWRACRSCRVALRACISAPWISSPITTVLLMFPPPPGRGAVSPLVCLFINFCIWWWRVLLVLRAWAAECGWFMTWYSEWIFAICGMVCCRRRDFERRTGNLEVAAT